MRGSPPYKDFQFSPSNILVRMAAGTIFMSYELFSPESNIARSGFMVPLADNSVY